MTAASRIPGAPPSAPLSLWRVPPSPVSPPSPALPVPDPLPAGPGSGCAWGGLLHTPALPTAPRLASHPSLFRARRQRDTGHTRGPGLSPTATPGLCPLPPHRPSPGGTTPGTPRAEQRSREPPAPVPHAQRPQTPHKAPPFPRCHPPPYNLRAVPEARWGPRRLPLTSAGAPSAPLLFLRAAGLPPPGRRRARAAASPAPRPPQPARARSAAPPSPPPPGTAPRPAPQPAPCPPAGGEVVLGGGTRRRGRCTARPLLPGGTCPCVPSPVPPSPPGGGTLPARPCRGRQRGSRRRGLAP